MSVESTLTAAICPDCHQVSDTRHDLGDPQTIRDHSLWDRRCQLSYLEYAPRRYKCLACRDTFVERVPWREPGLTYTDRYARHVYERARRESVSQVARDERLTEEIVAGIFARGAQKKLDERGYPRVKVLCLDEVAPHKGHGNYRLIISAPEERLVLEVCCADMWDAYHQAAVEHLPNARQVVDRFHVMKNLTDVLTKARRALQKQVEEPIRSLLKGSRWLLVKNKENLTIEEAEKLSQMLEAVPLLKTCYELKEGFRAWFNDSPDRATATERLSEWLDQVKASGLKALQAFTKTVENWRERILNYFEGRHSNGFAEGVNLKIKMISRRAYGYRNFAHFRWHVLLAFGS